MKRCPTCNKTFTDRNLSFCIDDGTPLATVVDPTDEATIVSPSFQSSNPANDNSVPPYLPPGTYLPPGAPPGQVRRKSWPWVVGILALVLLLFAGLGIGAILIFQRFRPGPDRAASNTNTGVYRSDNYNSNQNSSSSSANENQNENADEEDSGPPTDEAKVLADLTELENEWTVANINADKKKLDRILGDDYVGTYIDGQTQGKAEYLRTIERDTTIQKWEFEDLKLDLNGDRAALTGIIRLQIQDKPVVYRFTDKFVWRDGRWQAVASEVTPIQ